MKGESAQAAGSGWGEVKGEGISCVWWAGSMWAECSGRVKGIHTPVEGAVCVCSHVCEVSGGQHV